MGATYTRQSTYEDGDTITSDHTNDEFDQLLAAFAASTGHTHDGTTAEGGPVTKLLGTSLTFGNGTSGTDITVTFDGESNDGVLKWMEDEDYFEFSDDLLIAAAEKIQFRDTGLFINSSADGQLDIVADTEVQIAATTIDINGNVDISGTLTVAGALDFGDAALSNVGALQLDSIAGDADTNTSITFSGSDVITFTNGGETQLTFNNGSILPTTNNDVDLGSDALEFKDIYIDGTAFLDTADIANISADTIVATNKKIQFRDTGLSINSSADGQLDIIADTEVQIAATTVDINGAVDVSGNLVVGGDLTITGDDLIMNTNTAGALLIADGTNFNPTVITDLSEIATAASGDILLAIDASGGGLKKITRSVLTAGLASDSAISNLIEDTSPQLGGNLDTNSQNILIDDAHFIADESGNEQIIFQTTGSAVNQFDVTNAASGNGPKLSATGGDTNIDLDLLAKGSGIIKVISPGGSGNSGAIQLNCESNSHGQILKSQPHSASATNTMLLPEGANSTLVSLVSTDTLTNKTLTSPKINEDVAVTSTATELNVLDGITAVVGELNALDLGSTAVGTAIASKAVILDSNKDYTGIRNLTISGEIDAATGDFSGAVDVAGALTNGSTLVSTGKITADAGIDIDNFNIDGTTIALSSGDMVLDGAADIILDAAGGDFKFKVGGTEILNITNSSSDVIIKPIVDAKDLIFQQRDGTEVARIEDNGTFNIVTDKLAINGTAVTSTAAELNKLDGVGTLKQAGKETIWVPSSAMQPTTSNGCSALTTVETTSGRPDLVVLDFDKDSDEFAQFSVAFPVSWNAGTVTFQVFWAGIAATSDVDWMVDAVAVSNNTTLDIAYGTAVVVTDNAQGAVEELNVSAESGAVTIAGSPGDDELCFFRIGRDVSGDDMAGDARLVGIKLFFTTDLANDA